MDSGVAAELAAAGDGDFKRSADLTHPVVAESAEAFNERSQRHTLYRVEVHGRPPRDRVIAWLEEDLARDPANSGRARPDQSAAQPWNRSVSGQHDDRPTSDLGELTPPHLASDRKCGHDAPAAARNEAKSPHSSAASSGDLSYAA
jgi:hypothetical protein